MVKEDSRKFFDACKALGGKVDEEIIDGDLKVVCKGVEKKEFLQELE